MLIDRTTRRGTSLPSRHLLKPMSSQVKQVFVGPALEAVLAAAAERSPSNEGSPFWRSGPSLGGSRRSFVTALLACALLALSASPLRAQVPPNSIAFPGSFWISAGEVGPLERGNVLGQAGVEQGITAWEHGPWFLVPHLAVTIGTDTQGYDWNNKHPSTLGVKLVRRVPGGVVQAGGGVMFERDPETGQQRHGTAFVNYWAGWTADRRAHGGAHPAGFPGHIYSSSGLLTGRDPHNWITTISAEQGIVAFRRYSVAVTPYVSGAVSFDTKRRTWENRVIYDAGVKLVRPVIGGVVEVGVA